MEGYFWLKSASRLLITMSANWIWSAYIALMSFRITEHMSFIVLFGNVFFAIMSLMAHVLLEKKLTKRICLTSQD